MCSTLKYYLFVLCEIFLLFLNEQNDFSQCCELPLVCITIQICPVQILLFILQRCCVVWSFTDLFICVNNHIFIHIAFNKALLNCNAY